MVSASLAALPGGTSASLQRSCKRPRVSYHVNGKYTCLSLFLNTHWHITDVWSLWRGCKYRGDTLLQDCERARQALNFRFRCLPVSSPAAASCHGSNVALRVCPGALQCLELNEIHEMKLKSTQLDMQHQNNGFLFVQHETEAIKVCTRCKRRL